MDMINSLFFVLNYLPHNEELVAIKVITHYDIFRVLEDDFNESSVISPHNSGVKIQPTSGGLIGNTSDSENSTDVEIIGEF